MTIYAEYLLLENAIINFIILYVTKRFTRTDTNKIRLIISSLIGGIYTFVVFYPSLMFMAKFIMKFIVSILMIIVAFNPYTLKKFLKLISTFYVVTFVFAGAALALFYLSDIQIFVGKGIFYIRDFPIKKLIFAVGISWILIKGTLGFIQSKIGKEKLFIPIEINLNNRNVKLNALVDTGNSLKDPISDRPVIIVEFKAIQDLLPIKVQDIFLKYKENNLDVVSTVMSKSNREISFRLIPFKSIGKDNGMLLGFKPDKVILRDEDNKILSEIIVGIYNNSLSPNHEYMALLHPEILK
ncbi:sigma-E processing peptidase SpoIIGA [Dethiothermospora halolimnae]|uniref:sigma-E processing peptidase SpoIIGA n=1 Tax=Dethiothermospora halolimnae TaxID=3114390 RepID=UPI003CCC41A3